MKKGEKTQSKAKSFLVMLLSIVQILYLKDNENIHDSMCLYIDLCITAYKYLYIYAYKYEHFCGGVKLLW